MTTNDPFTEAARIIDEHRTTGRWVGDGVRVECTCGHISTGSHPGGPQTDEDNAHRDADRKHAAHVAQVLAAQEPTDAEAQAYLAAFSADLPADTEWTPDTIARVKRGLRAARRDEVTR